MRSGMFYRNLGTRLLPVTKSRSRFQALMILFLSHQRQCQSDRAVAESDPLAIGCYNLLWSVTITSNKHGGPSTWCILKKELLQSVTICYCWSAGSMEPRHRLLPSVTIVGGKMWWFFWSISFVTVTSNKVEGRNPQVRHCHTRSSCSHSHSIYHTHTQAQEIPILAIVILALPAHTHTRFVILTLSSSYTHTRFTLVSRLSAYIPPSTCSE